MMIRKSVLCIILYLAAMQFVMAQWHSQNCNTTEDLKAVAFVDMNHGWISDSDSIYHSDNGGDNWELQSDKGGYISFVSELIGWTAKDTSIYRTTDGGMSWNLISLTPNNHRVDDIFFLSSLRGYISVTDTSVSDWGIYSTKDGGFSWDKEYITIYQSGKSLYFKDTLFGWAVATSGTILMTYNGGQIWVENTAGSADECFFIDFWRGWKIHNGSIFNTSGGNKWDTQYVGSIVLTKIFMVNLQNGYCIGEGGTILYTNNGGDDWQLQQSGTTENLIDVLFIDENYGWIVGENGTVLHTNNGGVVGVDKHQTVFSKNDYSCYPNPFTTSTTIQYELTEPTHVQLSIYNHLGEAVEEVVSAYKLPGVYTYKWGAERLSEGMYFAVLRSGDGVSVVKLIKR